MIRFGRLSSPVSGGSVSDSLDFSVLGVAVSGLPKWKLRRRIAAVLLGAGSLSGIALGQAMTSDEIVAKMKTLRGMSATERPGATDNLALQIRALPAGAAKVKLANGLAGLATECDPGKAILADVATTLAEALSETPIAMKSGDPVPEPYMEVADILRYEGVTIDPKLTAAPVYTEAKKTQDAQDADVQAANFTLKDLKGTPVTLSELRGKVVMVNFWATWCPPCRKEMPDLDQLQARLGPKGLVILSISDEDRTKVEPFIAKTGYRPTVLLHSGRRVNEMFHVQGIPKSFVFDRKGKLVATTIDERSERQFLEMFAAAGLKE